MRGSCELIAMDVLVVTSGGVGSWNTLSAPNTTDSPVQSLFFKHEGFFGAIGSLVRTERQRSNSCAESPLWSENSEPCDRPPDKELGSQAPQSALREELSALKLGGLSKRAIAAGVDSDALEMAQDVEDKSAIIELIVQTTR